MEYNNELKYNMNNSSKQNIVFIFTTGRSLSTAYLRTFLNCPEVKVFNDQFAQINNKDILIDKSKLSHEELAKMLYNKIFQIFDSNKNIKTVILKDICHIVYDFFLNVVKSWEKKFNTKYIYIVRHPKSRYISLKKMLDEEYKLNRLPFDFLKSLENNEDYRSLWGLYKIFGGKVIISEELQENPTKIFKESFEFCSIKFNEEVLTYEPLNKIGIPEDMEFAKNWYVDAFNSTYFRPGVTNIDSIIINDETVLKRLKIS